MSDCKKCQERLDALEVDVAALRAEFDEHRDKHYQRASNRIPIDPFRERYLELEAKGQITAEQLAIRLGYDRNGPPDRRQALRAVGMVSYPDGKYGKRIKQSTRIDFGLRLAEVLGLDPHEVGL